MAQLLLIRGAKQLLTLRGPDRARRGAALNDLAIIPDGSILIRDGRIHSVGTTRRIENLKEARNAVEFDASGLIAMPAFVDGEIRLSPDLSKAPGKRKRMTEFSDETTRLLRACQDHGTLHARVKIGADGLDWRSDLSLMRQLAKLGDNLIGVIRTWRIDQRPQQDALLPSDYGAALSLLASRKLIHSVEVAAGTYAPVSKDMWTALAHLKGVAISLLCRGNSAEMLANVLQRIPARSVHCSGSITPAESAVLAKASIPVTLPAARCIADDTTRGAVRELARAGAAMALSSGYHSREMPVFNMQTIVALGVLRLGLSAEQAISATTINAAHALGLGYETGSIELGKRADLLLLNLPDYRELPRQFGANHVDVAVRGKAILFSRSGRKESTL